MKYTRKMNSELIEKIEYLDGGASPLLATTRSFEADRNLITKIKNYDDVNDQTISQYLYRNDALGRRSDVVYTGTAFAADHLFKWGYNDRSELTAADRYQSTDPDTPTNQYGTNGAFDYAYDPIGNRESYQLDGGTATTYTTNAVNQYTATANPSESFAYDADGNLTSDGTWTLEWDAENRLRSIYKTTPSQGTDKKLVFEYDYMGRRVRKQVFSWDPTLNGGAGDWKSTPDTDQRFVYDEWNVVLVLNGKSSNTIIYKYTWGLDLSGQTGQGSAEGIHGAGGIGGLLACQDVTGAHQGIYWFLYDANGNVGQVVKDATGYPVVAHYEYDPYGNFLSGSGTYADANPFRFSTKWWDVEVGMYYYGYRYYSPKLGRWLSRDPIEEWGGINLYQFTGSCPIINVDALGQQAEPLPWVPPMWPYIPEGFGCTVVRQGGRLLSCCTTVIGAAVTVICTPSDCGGGGAKRCPYCGRCSSEIHREDCPVMGPIPSQDPIPVPKPEPAPAEDCDEEKKDCRRKHPEWQDCDSSGLPFASRGAAWEAVRRQFISNQFRNWSHDSGIRPVNSTGLCGHLDGNTQHRNVVYTRPGSNRKITGPRYSVYCCSCCNADGSEGKRCDWKHSSGK